MKLALSLSLISLSAFASLPHMDLELTTSEYRSLLKTANKREIDPTIAEGLRIGERLSQWIEFENSKRQPELAIRLTSAQTRVGYPISNPNFYSPRTIRERLDKVYTELPAIMKQVLQNKDGFPHPLPVDDETFIKFGRIVDRIYQSSARFNLLSDWQDAYALRANDDVRGIYYLNTNKWDSQKLSDISQVDPKTMADLKKAIYGICLNSVRKPQRCKPEVESAFKNNEVAKVYEAWMPRAQEVWNTFFVLPDFVARKDVTYKTEKEMKIPFNTPSIAKFGPYLKDNVQDEWKWGDWQLKVIFGNYPNSASLEFEAGTVPHVNGLGGNQIVMDSNQPIEEYESQWTIRHEFGHVLGFPDCYHEFYDVELQGFVNYQLDTTDLMCSRAGNMNERLYLELKRVYFKR